MFQRSLEKRNIIPRILEFSSINSLKACLKLGVGVTICPAVGAAPEFASGSLSRLNWDRPHEEIPVIMLWHREKWCSPLLKDFMALTLEQFKEKR